MSRPHFPADQVRDIERQANASIDEAVNLAARWQFWSDAIANLARDIPPMPKAFPYLNQSGNAAEVEVQIDFAKLSDLRHRRLQPARDQAAAYCAELRRTARHLMNASDAAKEVARSWIGKRYFPQFAYKSVGVDRFVIVDTGPDYDGYWHYRPIEDVDTWDRTTYEGRDQAASDAHRLNLNPEPYPEGWPRGRWIVHQGSAWYELIDRGEDLQGWTLVESSQHNEDLLASAEKLRSGAEE